MQVTLTEAEIKQAITDYLFEKFVANIEITNITITAGSKAKGVVTQVDVSTTDFPMSKKVCDHNPKNTEQPIVVLNVAPQKVTEPKVKELVVKEPVIEAIPVVKEPVIEEPKVITPIPETKAVEESVGVEDIFGEIVVIEGEAPTIEEAPIVEGENVMTTDFDLPVAEPIIDEPIVDDVEDLFAC